jgi:trafficking protein particle complex subunit 12
MGFNDARRGVMGYYELAREARLTLTALKKSRTSTLSLKGAGDEEERLEVDVDDILEAEINVWETRLQELGIRVASALVEMEDLEGATRFLSTLSPSSSSSLDTLKALLYLCLGDVEAARHCISNSNSTSESSANETTVILALAHMADANFTSAATLWSSLISISSPPSSLGPSSELPMYRQNLGVCLLYLGRMSEVGPPPPCHALFLNPLSPLLTNSSSSLTDSSLPSRPANCSKN